MKNVKYVNRGEFVEMVKNPKFYSGCNLMGYDALTEEKLTGGKKNPMQGRVRKNTLKVSIYGFRQQS